MSTVTVTFAGRTLQARDGQSVAAALTAAGVRSWRTTRRGERPRGLFCGIGVCFDCLLTIDGRPAQRACLVPVRDGMIVGETGGD
jgi:predicted molibdopterin-dependent oxidoreductase YjgC